MSTMIVRVVELSLLRSFRLCFPLSLSCVKSPFVTLFPYFPRLIVTNKPTRRIDMKLCLNRALENARRATCWIWSVHDDYSFNLILCLNAYILYILFIKVLNSNIFPERTIHNNFLRLG